MNTHYSDPTFVRQCMMGPNSLRLIRELLSHVRLPQGLRILDLGPGMGLTSMHLAEKYKARVLAADLWIDPTDNYHRFRQHGFEDSIIPLRAEAHSLPFSREYFDAVVSIDSYHYFGAAVPYFAEHIIPLLRKDGLIIVAVPGLKKDFTEGIPPELAPYWQDNMNFYSVAWWRELWSQTPCLELLFSGELRCHAQAWEDWLACENPHAVSDRSLIKAEAGRYFSTVGMIARLKRR